MPVQELIDLDKAAPADRRVKLAGKTWKVPGDAPTGWLLTFRQIEKDALGDETDELELVERMRDALADLFMIRHPAQEEEILGALDEVGVTRLLPMVGQIYAAPLAEVGEGPPDPPKPAGPAGTASTRRTAPRSRSRSSRSSAS